MLAQVFTLTARHALTGVGLVLINNGYADAAQVDLLVGAGMTIAGVIWSIAEKRLRGLL